MTKMNLRSAMILGLALGLMAAPARAAEPKFASNPPSLDLKVDRSRSLRVKGGDWDDKMDRVQMIISIRNKSLNSEVKGLTAHFWLIARSAVDRKVYKIAQTEEFPVDLTSTRPGRELEHETEEIVFKFDRTDAVFGESYHGWILVLENAKDEVVAVKASSPMYEKKLEKVFALKDGDWIDQNFEPATEPSRN